jgi:type I restriction enzyme R subunit
LGEAERETLDPILDACVTLYQEQLDEDGQVDFKGKAKRWLGDAIFGVTYQPQSSTNP